MATGTMIGTGIAPTLITATSLFLRMASGGDYDYYDYSPYDYNDQSAYVDSDQYGNNTTVSAVQSELAKLGYYHGSIDGVVGDETQAALARYQEDHDLSVTGTLTAATLQSLGLPRTAS
ncbi:MAG: hypothetical protein DME71_11025 [Verrucomicrobia bacterium]|nr:MAG: hypothetical protein DME71_11025 [Verrucomicrobiota bacterium]